MRLFVALLPPRRVCDELARALAPHRGEWPQLRWVDPANWHLTLAFLGEVPEEVLPGLELRLARAASRYAPMTLAFAGAGAFPSARRARVLWAGLRGGGESYGGRPEIVRLADSVAAGARREGIEVDDRRFKAHLTLARARTRGDLDARPLVEALEPFTGAEWEAESVHLMRSDFGSPQVGHSGAGVRYETVARWPLAARAPRGQG
ncbi:RNA 2',3'-cyclic phosphodiesterase [Planomonospora corallina]|uniref:RNA 2',3'-cyclic phosphodiesterase n=1 Tax=Planomonospora corallina TaxID=1806052 RepID=A0ABV8IB76_9ACTN